MKPPSFSRNRCNSLVPHSTPLTLETNKFSRRFNKQLPWESQPLLLLLAVLAATIRAKEMLSNK